jgi:hypothetical protein
MLKIKQIIRFIYSTIKKKSDDSLITGVISSYTHYFENSIGGKNKQKTKPFLAIR